MSIATPEDVEDVGPGDPGVLAWVVGGWAGVLCERHDGLSFVSIARKRDNGNELRG